MNEISPDEYPEQKILLVESKPMTPVVVNIEAEIQKLFDNNRLSDLKSFMKKRRRLNVMNTFLMYGFHIFQSAGILTTTIATGYNFRELIWVGVGLNVLSSLMNIFEKINTSISTNLMKNITSIKEGTYVDEGVIVNDIKKDSKSATSEKPEADSVD